MLQFASKWLKKTTTVMALALMVVSTSAQSVMALAIQTQPVGSSYGDIYSVTPTLGINPVLMAAVYSPASSVLSNAKATPSTFKPSNGEKTTIHFDLNGPSTVWIDIMQNGATINRLLFNAGTHMTGGGYDKYWNGLDGNGNLVGAGTYQFLITAKLDATGQFYTAQDNIVVAVDAPLQPVTITTSNASPNPINPNLNQITTVSYTLNTQTNLNIEVVDGSTPIVQLSSSPLTQNAGTYPVTWNGKYSNGTVVPAKTYYIRFTGLNAATQNPYVTTVPVTVDYGTVSQNPKVTYVYAENSSFNPNTTPNRIHFAVDKAALAVVKILDANNNTVRTLATTSASAATDYNTPWDGRNDNNVLVAAGNYTAKVELSLAGVVVDSKTSAAFAVDFGSVNNTAPVVTSVTVNPSTFNPSNNESTTVSYTLDKPATSAKVEVVKPCIDYCTPLVVRTINNTGVSSTSANTTTFNGRDDNGNVLPTGTYTVRVTATNAYGSGSNTAAVYLVNNGGTNNTAPVVTSVTVNPSTFNPSNSESTTVSYTLDKPATSAMVQVLDSNNNIRRSIYSTGTSSTSTNTTTFNGRDDNGNVLPYGTYTVRVTATNAYGSGSNTTTVYLSTNGNNGNCNSNGGTPNLTNVYTSASTFNPNNQSVTVYYNVDRAANVTVEVLNSSSSVVRTLSDNICKNSGSGTYSWDGRDMYNNMVNNGAYTIRVRANNGTGTDTEYTYVTVNRDGSYNNNGTLVLNLYVQPEIFNPRNGQTSTAYYNLNQSANVTTEILDKNGVVIRTLVDNVTRYSNNYAYNTSYGSYNYADQWNGRDVYGNIVPDNVYQFRVRATATNGGQTDSKTAWVEVDTDGIIIGFPNGSTCAGYIDVSTNSPYCKAIQLMKDNGVFTGYTDGTFRPYQQINRAETVKVILLALSIPTVNYNGTLFFDTDNNAWYAPYLRTAKSLGIIRGYPDGSFRPEQTINRVELLKVFLESSGVNVPYCNYAPYKDTPVNADTRWYIDYACYAKSNGLMHDDGTGRLSPAAPMTRGDVADLFYQFEVKGLYNKNNNPYYNGTYTSVYNNGYYTNNYYNGYNYNNGYTYGYTPYYYSN